MATLEHTSTASLEAKCENIEDYIRTSLKYCTDYAEGHRHFAYQHAVGPLEAFESLSNRRRQSRHIAYSIRDALDSGRSEKETVVTRITFVHPLQIGCVGIEELGGTGLQSIGNGKERHIHVVDA